MLNLKSRANRETGVKLRKKKSRVVDGNQEF